MSDHEYSGDFYSYIDAGSRRSARVVAGLLLPEMKIASLLDVGAGPWRLGGGMAGGGGQGRAGGGWRLCPPRPAGRAQQELPRPRSGDPARPQKALRPGPDAGGRRAFAGGQGRPVRRQPRPARRRHPVFRGRAAPGRRASRQRAAAGILAPEVRWRAATAVFDFLRPRLDGRGEVMPWYRFNSYVYANEAGQKRLSEADAGDARAGRTGRWRSAATWPGRCAGRRCG